MFSSGSRAAAITRRSQADEAATSTGAEREQPPQPLHPAGLGQHQRQHQRRARPRRAAPTPTRSMCPRRAGPPPRGQQPGGQHQRQRSRSARSPGRSTASPSGSPARARITPPVDRPDRGGDARRWRRRSRTPARARPRGTAAGSAPSSAGPSRRRPGPGTAGPTISQPGARRRPGQRAAQHERGQREHEHAPPAERVAEPPGRDQRQPEGQRVAGDHPLHAGRRRCPARAGSRAARPRRC